jgi:CO/xanthine dehydrogenase Mo-binding subunit
MQIDPELIRITRPNSLESLPGNSPVGSRMAIMLGGAAARAGEKLKAKIMAIAAYRLGVANDQLCYEGGDVLANDGRRLAWDEMVELAHRQYHNLPDGMDPCQLVMPCPLMTRCRCILATHSNFIFCWCPLIQLLAVPIFIPISLAMTAAR